MGRRTQQRRAKLMSDSINAEVQHWQARTDDMQVALDRLREERDQLRAELAKVANDARVFRQMVERLQIAMSQGAEL
jgi:chromosome segregation ATPase